MRLEWSRLGGKVCRLGRSFDRLRQSNQLLSATLHADPKDTRSIRRRKCSELAELYSEWNGQRDPSKRLDKALALRRRSVAEESQREVPFLRRHPSPWKHIRKMTAQRLPRSLGNWSGNEQPLAQD